MSRVFWVEKEEKEVVERSVGLERGGGREVVYMQVEVFFC